MSGYTPKVGDRVRRVGWWAESDWVEVLFVGRCKFFGRHPSGDEFGWSFDWNWELVPERPELPDLPTYWMPVEAYENGNRVVLPDPFVSDHNLRQCHPQSFAAVEYAPTGNVLGSYCRA